MRSLPYCTRAIFSWRIQAVHEYLGTDLSHKYTLICIIYNGDPGLSCVAGQPIPSSHVDVCQLIDWFGADKVYYVVLPL